MIQKANNANLIIMGIKLNMHIKLITTQAIHTHGYNTGIMPGLPTPFLPARNLCNNSTFAYVYRISNQNI